MRTTTDEVLYQRGKYSLKRRLGTDGVLESNSLYIFYYDESKGRIVRISTGTSDQQAAELKLDALYMQRERGQQVCPTCHRPLDDGKGHLLAESIQNYLVDRQEVSSIAAVKARLAHVLDFLEATAQIEATCEAVDDAFIQRFRKWSSLQPVIENQQGDERPRAAGTTEASVRQLAAAINFSHKRRDAAFPATFKVLKPSVVSITPTYRSDVAEIAEMFRYCLYPQPQEGTVWTEAYRLRQIKYRSSLLRFLQASVATWARPDAVYDISTEKRRGQWIPAAQVLQLNPVGRMQTNKYRPAVPVPPQFARLLNETNGYFVGVANVRKAFETMQDYLGLPRDRETGMKLIRRSIATVARRRLGEEYWAQGRMMLGHLKHDISDLYALPDPRNIGRALKVTEDVITEIEALCPRAFTPNSPQLRLIEGGGLS